MAKTFGSILNAFSGEPKKESVAHMTQVREDLGLIIIETQAQIQTQNGNLYGKTFISLISDNRLEIKFIYVMSRLK